jgi:hypothetical protein
MANASAGRTAKAKKPATATWHELAAVTDAKRRLWMRSQNRTGWAVCGREWDVVAVAPMAAGLDALAAMRADTRRGYQVLADHLSDRRYVAVPTGSSGTFEDIPGVRVLSSGHQLLTPSTPQDGTIAADWVSHQRGDKPPALIAADRLAERLREPHRSRTRSGARVMDGYTVLYDPEGRIDAELPLDLATHERVARAVLATTTNRSGCC